MLDPGELIEGRPRAQLAIARLICSIYGTRQAALNWYKRFNDILEAFGFTRSTIEAGVYYRGNLLLLIWADDILMIGSKADIGKAKEELKKELKIKELGEVRDGTFLGMTVRRDRGGKRIYLGQGGYLHKVLERFGMRNAHQ